MKRNLRALAYIIDTTIYNVISTPFSTVARAVIEGQKYFNFVSDKINGKNPSFNRKIGGYTFGGVAAILGAILGVAKELLTSVGAQSSYIVNTVNILLGINKYYLTPSYSEAEKIFNKVNGNVSKERNTIVNKLITVAAYASAAVTYIGSMVTYSPYTLIKDTYENFNDQRIKEFKNTDYLANGDYKATAKNMAYSPVKFVTKTVKNIIGSFATIPAIMFNEAKRYYNWGNIAKSDSNIAVKAAGIVTGAAAGAIGIVTGAVEGGLDTVAYEANEVEKFVERIGGYRKFDSKTQVEVFYDNKPIVSSTYNDFRSKIIFNRKDESLGLSLTR